MNVAQRVPVAATLPTPQSWQSAAARRPDLFQPLDHGARVALVPRAEPRFMLLWEVEGDAAVARIEPFGGFSSCRADVAMSADGEALALIRAASDESLFGVLRAGIRSGHVVCYILRRRCHLEERGFEELLTELGFAFMGACR